MTLKREIQVETYRLGFDLAGVTRPDPPPHIDVYTKWVDANRHGEMMYLATPRACQRRADPRLVLPTCQSILVLGQSYPQVIPLCDDSEPGVRIASYAQGQDYHVGLGEKLQELVCFIEERVGRGVASLWYTDTGPVLERDLAQQAGLGWIGKNTCLIHPRLGSYLFLAEIFLDLALEPDPPFVPDRCGTCQRCIEACPTHCILPDRTLDARRCISYLTIELKGAIPRELRSSLGHWAFGCDICQQVCPWNRFAVTEHKTAYSIVEWGDEMRISAEGFRQKYLTSPILRTKRQGYLRNLATVLGNLQDPRSVSALAQTLREEGDPLIRAHAAWALGQIPEPAAQNALEKALSIEMDENVRAEIVSAQK